MSLQAQNNQKILFIGDSITDVGRRVAERPYGNGFVKIFRDMLIAREPEKQIEIINKGIGGNTVWQLRDRWTDDMLFFKPDYLVMLIGINDLHQFLNGSMEKDETLQKHKDAYDEILARTVKELPDCKILLLEPFFMSRDTTSKSSRTLVLDLLPDYTAVTRQMSEKYNTGLIETQKLFQNILKYYETDTICSEPVHPNTTGHLAIAEAVYNALSAGE
ncbi:MAG: SGNH/GDSL hydrolase family protein [Victivallaceae bacterium]|nr:SGNH/GDSL hydrolase family protein [Victivallaceae bacterium]